MQKSTFDDLACKHLLCRRPLQNIPLENVAIMLHFSFLYHVRIKIFFLAYPTGISVNPTRARKCRPTWGGVRWLVHDLCMTSARRFLTSWRHFHISFCRTVWRQCIREEPHTELFLIKQHSYFSINLIKQHIFKSKCNCGRHRMQEKESIMVLRCKLKIPSLG